MTYSPETKAEALRLLREEGWTKTRVTACLGVGPDALRKWLRPMKPPPFCWIPVRLRVRRVPDELVLMRGTEVLVVLAVRRAGAWEVSLAGATHARALRAVLPVLVARMEGVRVLPFAEATCEMPAAPTPRAMVP